MGEYRWTWTQQILFTVHRTLGYIGGNLKLIPVDMTDKKFLMFIALDFLAEIRFCCHQIRSGETDRNPRAGFGFGAE
jgi:hypothetical protein